MGVSDPFRVWGTTNVQQPMPAQLTFSRLWPNPARGQVLLRFGLPRATDVRLEIFDVQGRRVRTLAAGRQEAGWHDLGWNGRGETGVQLSAGLYFVRLRAEGREFRQRLVWLE